jgi:two-component system chemotaxis response regulator CheB
MKALPDTVTTGKGEISTRLACPQCAGVLTVHAEGAHHHLIFTCRVGHKFSVRELVAGKEDRLEEYLWEALHGLEEMAALLHDLSAYAERQGVGHLRGIFEERAGRRLTPGRSGRSSRTIVLCNSTTTSP